LGLSRTLHKLYNLTKSMADCVVPQEYGTTVEEKRSVGLKICHSLLEKIKYDIGVARTDNDTDMRYLINMDYSFDLNINTMGRRIRTRLYFTSESHLHTVLNTFRFGHYDGCKSLLSQSGLTIVNATPELCYLTQIVMRVFEDSRRDINDPRRFRVELLFSPGATATPFHMGENDREADSSRLDTAPLQGIGREDLTCQEVEDFLESAIMAGRGEEDEFEIASMSTAPAEPLKRQLPAKVVEGDVPAANPARVVDAASAIDAGIPSRVVLDGSGSLDVMDACKTESAMTRLPSSLCVTERKGVDAPAGSEDCRSTSRHPPVDTPPAISENSPAAAACNTEGSSLGDDSSSGDVAAGSRENKPLQDTDRPSTSSPTPPGPTPVSSLSSSSLTIRKYFWTAVALGSFTLGVGCLLMATGVFDQRYRGRRYVSVSPKYR
jgi:inositol hexakisphosphate/diphosphoinositol-pentakisphosphate kinase